MVLKYKLRVKNKFKWCKWLDILKNVRYMLNIILKSSE